MASRGKSARLKGHNFEREVMHKFIEAGYTDCKTSRNESRLMDALKVDLCHTGNWNVQCKAQERLSTGLHEELRGMPNSGINVVFWKKSNKGGIVSMSEESFFKILPIIKDAS